MRRARMFATMVLFAMAGCNKSESARIAVVGGGDGINGALIAEADVNVEGGVGGKPLALVVVPYERATSAAPSLTIADSLTRNPSIIAVVGHSNSAASLAASQIYNARGVPQLAPTSTAPLFTQAGPYSFRLVPDDRRQAEFMARHAAASARRVAIMYVNDDYGRGLRATFADDLRKLRVEVVSETPYLEEKEDRPFETATRDFAASHPDLLVWLGRAPELERFLVILRPRLALLPVLASDGVDAPAIYSYPERFRHVRFVRFIDPTTGSTQFEHVRARYREVLRREITSEAALTYDAVRLIVEAMRSGAGTRDEVKDYLAATGRTRPAYQGITGAIAFDENGDVARQHLLAEATPTGVRAVRP
jgi:branched-chain amino acid transport system substrate-binding protein